MVGIIEIGAVVLVLYGIAYFMGGGFVE